jgi:nucleotidyltransferase/DNA polymerase involved in DNA repair
MPGWLLERVLGRAVGEKLTALAWNRDPREIKTRRRAQSAGAQSTLGKKSAEERVFRPTLRHLADRIATRLRAKARPGRTVTIRVRFADLRSVTLDTPISATATLGQRSCQGQCILHRRYGRHGTPGHSRRQASLSFLRTTLAKNPRTECDCQPVDSIMVAIVAPLGRRSSSSTRACLEFARVP